MGRAIPCVRLQVDCASAVPDLPGALLGGRDEQVSFRLRRNDEIFLRPARVRNQDEFDFPALHRSARLRIEIVVPDVSATVEEESDFDLALLRAREDLLRERRHVLAEETACGGQKRRLERQWLPI